MANLLADLRSGQLWDRIYGRGRGKAKGLGFRNWGCCWAGDQRHCRASWSLACAFASTVLALPVKGLFCSMDKPKHLSTNQIEPKQANRIGSAI